MSKREAKKLMTNSNLIDKKRCTIKNFNFIFFFFLVIYENEKCNLLSKKQICSNK